MNAAERIAAWYRQLSPEQQQVAEHVQNSLPAWMVDSLEDMSISTVPAELVIDGTKSHVVLMTTAVRAFLESKALDRIPLTDDQVRTKVVRAIARSVVGDATTDIDDAERVLANLLARGAMTMRLDMAIDSSTTALSPFVDVSFRDGTQVIKTFAELDLPNDLDID